MGVTGLWRLIEPAGKPVPVETLENKVLAVDISIWLHQMVKGYQDAKGAPLPNAHLMGLFQRLCKLLYFRIKPVFVFDGGFPDLKKETIAKRQENKSKYNSESERIRRELAILLSKKTAIGSLLGKQISPKKLKTADPSNPDDLFKLPAVPQREESESESDEEDISSGSSVDVHTIDLESNKFKNLPTKEKYDLLLELKETRKMNSWGKLHELPKKSDNFSDFQMQRLLKRRKIQLCLEETEKEMGDGGMSLNDLESLLNEEGIDTKIESLPTRRIASNNTTRYLLINNVKQALAQAKERIEAENNPIASETDLLPDNKSPKKDELQEDLKKAIQMSLECTNEADNSMHTSITDDSWTTVMTDSEYSYSDSEEDGFQQPDNMSSAKAYIMQYTDYTHKAIEKLVCHNKSKKLKSKVLNVDNVLEEINNEKSVIVDKLEISSSDDEDYKIKVGDAKNQTPLQLNTSLENCVKNHSRSVENRQSTDEMDEDLQKAIKMSLESISEHNSTCTSKTDDSISLITSDTEHSKSDANQSSLIFIESPVQNISLLDTSTENNEKNIPLKGTNTDNIKQESSSEESSDDDFEEVPESSTNRPVIQLTLKMDEVAEDDIFADVFTTTKSESVTDSIENNINSETQLAKTSISNLESKSKLRDVELKVIKTSNKRLNELPKETIPVSEIVKLPEIPKKSIPEKVETLNIVTESIPSDSSGVTSVANPVALEKLSSMANEIQIDEENLIQEKGRLDRIGRNITEQMRKEVQELLQLFGIPYVIAPMEAEAQCAFLEEVKLTDGTITDDSDIWLFGGKTVYKNFFNQKKHVLQFLAERVEKSFNLTREQLILLALLVGSDYTVGVTGVGPVTALEILASFPFNKKKLLNETSKQAQYNQLITGLQEFKQWVRAGKRTDNVSLKKKLRNINIKDDFPSIRVVQAYFEPNIEKSEEKFTWGELDITLLRDYTKSKFGWSQNKLDEIIKPVLKRMHDRKNQKTLKDYFKRKTEFQSLEDQMSKRVKAAVQKMGPDLETSDQQTIDTEIPKRKRTIKKNKGDNIASTSQTSAAPSKAKKAKNSEENVLKSLNVKIETQKSVTEPSFDIKIHKTNSIQDIIPQREKDKQNLLQNRLKAIEIFRKTNIDKKMKVKKRRPHLPKEKANLSESSDSD